MKSPIPNPEDVREKVQAGYREIALHGSERRKSSCCSGMSNVDSDKLARQMGYSPEDLARLPEGANIGLSCGNPGALAALRPGEVLLDLGSGAGFDAFVAGPKVGPTGRVIGVDMTGEMLARARKNIAAYRERTGLNNVEFRLGEIEHLPVADASVDAVISNCVINLSPDKGRVWCEIARVLKPGGRVAVSDLALLQPLPSEISEMVEALVGCVAGAVLVSETERMAREAGLSEIQLNPKSGYVDSLVEWQDPLYQKIMAHLPAGKKPGDYITSLEVTARKPACCKAISAPADAGFESGSGCCSSKD
jgi:SAM-dependent methyltransferase